MFDYCFLVDIQFFVRVCEKCAKLLREDSFFCAISRKKRVAIFNIKYKIFNGAGECFLPSILCAVVCAEAALCRVIS